MKAELIKREGNQVSMKVMIDAQEFEKRCTKSIFKRAW